MKECIDKVTLEKLYNKSGLSTGTIASRYGTNSQAILKLLAHYGIPRRLRGGGKT